MRVPMFPQTSDATLLDRFVSRREEAAFAELVDRHGALVLRVCRRFLRSEQDVEDVFQATFLVLARRAAAISWNVSVAGWLHAVARRLALDTRGRVSRRRLRECPVAVLARGEISRTVKFLPDRHHPVTDYRGDMERGDLSLAVDEALGQLPEKYRAPVILCYFEGKTNAEAARQLGWPAGSMSRRLERARGLLREKLVHAGVVFVLAFFCVALAVVRTRSSAPDHRRGVVSVKQVMKSMQGASKGEPSLHAVLDDIDRSGGIPDAEQFLALARKSERAANQLAVHDPGKKQETWQYHAARMRLAAIDLGRAAILADRTAMVGAARNLDATCVRCHEIFRPALDVGKIGVREEFHNPL
jgi:RNA polymerase sigma-70 factor (ECF subfamily)